MKTLLMLAAVAALTGAVTGCFWMSSDGKAAPAQRSCAGLEGQVLAECEAAKASSSAPRR